MIGKVILDMQERIVELESAVKGIVDVLSPEIPYDRHAIEGELEGLRAEVTEALRIAREALKTV